MIRRLINWLLGSSNPEDAEAHARIAEEKDRQRTEAIYQGDKSNITGPRR